jgi:hypothetical protein
MTEARSYPRQAKTDAGEIEFRPMSRADEAQVLDFAQRLPTHDLLFLPRNISQPKVLSPLRCGSCCDAAMGRRRLRLLPC